MKKVKHLSLKNMKPTQLMIYFLNNGLVVEPNNPILTSMLKLVLKLILILRLYIQLKTAFAQLDLVRMPLTKSMMS
jgi:hypothetical protein